MDMFAGVTSTRFGAPWWPLSEAVAPLRAYGAGFDLPGGVPSRQGDVASVVAAQLLLRAVGAGQLNEVGPAGVPARTTFARLLLRAAGVPVEGGGDGLAAAAPVRVSARLEEALAAEADRVVSWAAETLGGEAAGEAVEMAVSDLEAGAADPRVATAAQMLASAAGR